MDITSAENRKIKQWQKLLSKKGRESQQAFLIEGLHLVEEALKANIEMKALIYDGEKGLPEAVEKNISPDVPIYAVPSSVIAKLSETKTPQGIVGVVAMPFEETVEAVLEKKWSEDDFFFCFLDEVQDPGNLGTIIRTADAAGLDGIILGKGTVDLYNPKTVRATMGSLFHLPIVKGDLPQWISRCQGAGAQVVATGLQEAVAYTEDVFARKSVVMIGNEANGVSPALQEMADNKVTIPIYGQAESLNAAVAAAVLFYEGIRQKKLS